MQTAKEPRLTDLLQALPGRLFLDHPRAMGESYFEHQRAALDFGFQMLIAGAACVIHALLPGAFEDTGSSTVSSLHARMKNRGIQQASPEKGSE